MSLYNDMINMDRQKNWKEMYDLVKSEFDKLKPPEQKKIEDQLGKIQGGKHVPDDKPSEGGKPKEGKPGEGKGNGEPKEGEGKGKGGKPGDKPGKGGKPGDKPGKGNGKGEDEKATPEDLEAHAEKARHRGQKTNDEGEENGKLHEVISFKILEAQRST